jgi:predicted anti-sigma-YlaC factor YlaD
MNCLKISDVYIYLDGGLSADERASIESHLDGCPRCRAEVKERRRLAEAASSLPPLDLPADFTQQVMVRILPAKASLPGWLIGLAAVLTPLALLIGIFIQSGENLLDLLSRFGDSVWVFLKNAAVLTAKALTLIHLAGKLLRPLAQAVYRLLAIVPNLISPTAQILILFVSLAFFVALICAFGKRFLAGEKT